MVAKDGGKRKQKIDDIQGTGECLTSRGGLAFFKRYIDETGYVSEISKRFSSLKKSAKGIKIKEVVAQLLCFFADGTNLHISQFDRLKADEGYAATIETAQEDLCSSDQIDRFMRNFDLDDKYQRIRDLLSEMFVSRLKISKPEVIEIMIDTMPMNNDDAAKREGVEYTYKRFNGFAPLNLIWNHRIIDTTLFGGSRHSNSGDSVRKAVERIVRAIREKYNRDAKIIFHVDTGFFDQKLYQLFDELEVYFVAGGRVYDWMFERVHEASEEGSFPKGEYKKNKATWGYQEFDYRCARWKKSWRGINTYLGLDETGQYFLDIDHPDRFIITNIPRNSTALPGRCSSIAVIEMSHSRGNHELVHRSIKEFGTEKLPYLKFNCNLGYYGFMALSHFAFSDFVQDCLERVHGATVTAASYAGTIRRRFFDIAAKIVRKGRRVVLKFSAAVLKTLKLFDTWKLCNNPVLLC